MMFARLLGRLIQSGSLTYIDGQGRMHHFGAGPLAGFPEVAIRVRDPSWDLRLGLSPLLTVGEAYMAGALTIESGDLYDFLALAAHNMRHGHHAAWLRWADYFSNFWRRWQQYNPLPRARRNAAHHYDVSLAFYDLFLDSDRQYSCAYFVHPGVGLEEAQRAKKRHIMAKLNLSPGLTVLDIGCGWGGLAVTLACEAGVEVTGITLSEQQFREAQKQAALRSPGRVKVQMTDYRQITGQFDRIVSVGMFEHVGVSHYRDFFAAISRLLADDGVALVHFICRPDGPGVTNPWVRKYIFPGGYSPALSEVLPAIEASGLIMTDIELLRLHYAETLAAWRRRFMANRDRAVQLTDERFCRMWEFYLAGAETAFRVQGHMVAQIQLTKQLAVLPLTRDYIAEAERSLETHSSVVREAHD